MDTRGSQIAAQSPKNPLNLRVLRLLQAAGPGVAFPPLMGHTCLSQTQPLGCRMAVTWPQISGTVDPYIQGQEGCLIPNSEP